MAGDTNGKSDVFVRNVVSGRTHRVDLGPNWRQANASAVGTAISANGRYVVFTSTASNLTRRPDTNHVSDVLVRDRKTGRTSAAATPIAAASLQPPAWVVSCRMTAAGWLSPMSSTAMCGTQICAIACARRARSGGPQGRNNRGHNPRRPLHLNLLFEDHHGTPFEYHVRDHVASREQKVPMPPNDATVVGAVMTPDARYVVFSAFNANSNGDDALRWRRGTAASTVVHGNNSNRYETDGSPDGRYVVYRSEDPKLVAVTRTVGLTCFAKI